jgi:hypothetical protein
MIVMRHYVIIVGNVISKRIKGALVFWNITLWNVVRKFHGLRDRINWCLIKNIAGWQHNRWYFKNIISTY